MSYSLDHVHALNRKAVYLLRCGKFEEAVSLLDNSLGFVRCCYLSNASDIFGSSNDNGAVKPLRSVAKEDVVNDHKDGDNDDLSSISSSSSFDFDLDSDQEAEEEDEEAMDSDSSSEDDDSHRAPQASKAALDTKEMASCCDDVNGCASLQSIPITPKADGSTVKSCQYYAFSMNIFEFYPRLFVLPPQQQQQQQGQQQEPLDAKVTMCYLLYNMAVAFHNIGIHLHQRRHRHPKAQALAKAHLEYALSLYNMAQIYLHSAWHFGCLCHPNKKNRAFSPQEEATRLLLALALSNNSGHIHTLLYNFQETRFSLDAVRHFMDVISKRSSVSRRNSSTSRKRQHPFGGLAKQDFCFFFQTSIIFEEFRLDLAPSA